MNPSLSAHIGSVVLRLVAPTPLVVLLSVHDESGRRVAHRRVRDSRVVLRLPPGTYRVTATDDRCLHDTHRHAGTTLQVTVTEHGVTESTLTLARGAVLTTTTSPWARLSAAHADGERLEVRADGLGRAVLAGLRRGAWTLVAHDARRSLCSEAVVVTLADREHAATDLPATIPTSRLLVQVHGSELRPVTATDVVVTDPTGRSVVAPIRGGLADVSSLRPGPVTVIVPASVGHRGTALAVDLAPGTLGILEAVVPVGASITGRVVQGRRQYAAVVALLDEDGVEVERVRTDEHGRFVLGTGLTATNGLTVVATTGPETLHVTRAAVADVCVLNGVRHDLGDIVLPVAGRRAMWTARTPAVAGMKLPSTRV